MAGEVASAYVSLLPSARGFGRSSERQIGPQMTGVAKRTGSRFGRVFAYASMSPLKAIGAAAVGLFAVQKVKEFFQGAIAEARESQKVSAITAQVIKSTGGAANVSAEQVGRLAGSISRLTGIDDEAIQSGANLLLTFKNLRNEVGEGNNVFDQATRIITDMSVALGTDVKGSAIQVGKALNDPIKGISALTRVGVTFTDQQKEQITALTESGKRLQAQKIILRELRTEFGGSAAAAATAGDKFRTAFANFQESVGTALLPYLDRLLLKGVQVIGFLENDVPRAFAAFRDAVSPAIAVVREFVEQHLEAFKTGLAALSGSATASLISLIGGGLVAAIGTLVAALTSPIALIGALAGAAVYAYVNFEGFRTKVNEFAAAFQTNVVPALLSAADTFQTRVLPTLTQFGNYLIGTAIPAVLQTARLVATNLRPVFEQLGETFRTRIAPVLAQAITQLSKWGPEARPAIEATAKLIATNLVLASQIAGKVLPVIVRLSGLLESKAAQAFLANTAATLKAIDALIGFVQAVGRAQAAIVEFVGKTVSLVKSLPGRILSALGDLGSLLYNAGRELIDGLTRGMMSKLGEVGSAAASIAGKIKGFFPGSPVKDGPLTSWNGGAAGKKLIQFLADGIIAGKPAVVAAALGAAKDVQSAVLGQLTEMRAGVQGVLSGLRADFQSLRDSVASVFTGDLFSAANADSFLTRLTDRRLNIAAISRAFKKLENWGLQPNFLAGLLQSGNGALILDLAAGTRQEARNANVEFGAIQSLSQRLGGAVARDSIGPRIDRTNNRLERIEKAIEKLPKNFGREINGANVAGSKGRVA